MKNLNDTNNRNNNNMNNNNNRNNTLKSCYIVNSNNKLNARSRLRKVLISVFMI